MQTLTIVADLRSSYLKAKKSGDKDAAKRYATDYYAFLVDGAFTVAHELVHCFVGFLSGDKKVGTPRSLLPKGYEDNPTRGESGRMWEELVFGGCVSYSLPQKKGVPVRVLMEKDNKEAQVDPDHIKDIAKGSTLVHPEYNTTCDLLGLTAFEQTELRFPLRIVGKWERI